MASRVRHLLGRQSKEATTAEMQCASATARVVVQTRVVLWHVVAVVQRDLMVARPVRAPIRRRQRRRHVANQGDSDNDRSEKSGEQPSLEACHRHQG
ncbi:MAG: hypothetical protein GEU74_10205 [Nitriliruptorales bacterium]|nr:hypothetical protein [Nitriliruptorales bacterium]